MGIMAVVNAPGKIPQLTTKFWKRIGGKIPGWVFKDSQKGLMQNNRQKLPLSKGYKKYKDHDMRRFSDNKRLGTARKLKDGTTRTYKRKKFPLTGSLQSIGVPYVTMLLTGKTIRGLRQKKADKNGVTMKFQREDTPKIIGNRRRGYDIVGLNTPNRRLIKVEIIKEFKKNKQKFLKKDIVVNVRI